jgi:hypothetical protein
MRNEYKILVGKPAEKKPLGRTGRRWKDNTKMDLKEIGCEVLDWIQLTQHYRVQWWALVNAALNLRAGKLFTS